MQIREEDEEEEEEEGDEEEEMIIREVLQGPAAASDFVVATVLPSSPALAEKRDREAEARLASLPARLDLIQDEEFVDDDEEEEEEDRDEMDRRGGKKDNGVAVVVVEKGRGALVHALDNTRDAESARSVMPGTFGGQREEEEEGEVVIVRQKQPEVRCFRFFFNDVVLTDLPPIRLRPPSPRKAPLPASLRLLSPRLTVPPRASCPSWVNHSEARALLRNRNKSRVFSWLVRTRRRCVDIFSARPR